MRHAVLSIVAVFAISACTAPPDAGIDPAQLPPEVSSSGSDCVSLFRLFDTMEKNMSTPTGWRDRVVAPPELMWMAGRLRQANCMTLTADLAGMEAVPVAPAPTAGPAISPISVHAGVVTNMNDDARSRAYFENQGIGVRTIGNGALGRRVYLGPFATGSEVERAMNVAREAGFAYPYVVPRF